MTEDKELLLEITEIHISAKQFRHHDKCYRDYARVLYATKIKIPVNKKGNYEDVCHLIEDDFIALQKSVVCLEWERTNISKDNI